MARTKNNQYKYVALKDGKEIYFTSHRDGEAKLGIDKSQISRAIMGLKVRLKQKGIVIFKIEDYEGLTPVREHKIYDNHKEKQKNGKNKVHMLDPFTNEILDTFASTAEAAEDIGAKTPNMIGRCCRGKIKMAYGYKWEYAD